MFVTFLALKHAALFLDQSDYELCKSHKQETLEQKISIVEIFKRARVETAKKILTGFLYYVGSDLHFNT